MKHKYSFLFVTIMLFIFQSSLIAQRLSRKEKKYALQVENVITGLSKAMVDADSLMLERFVSERLSYGHSSGVVEGKKAFIDKIISGKSDFENINLSEQSIVIFNKTATVRHQLYALTKDKGVPGEVRLKVLLVWHKEKRHWKLIARQAVKITS